MAGRMGLNWHFSPPFDKGVTDPTPPSKRVSRADDEKKIDRQNQAARRAESRTMAEPNFLIPMAAMLVTLIAAWMVGPHRTRAQFPAFCALWRLTCCGPSGDGMRTPTALLFSRRGSCPQYSRAKKANLRLSRRDPRRRSCSS